MENFKSVYEPREDSTLLEKYVRQYAKGSVLDIGTGSGLQAKAAAHNTKVNSVIALDVQKNVIDYCEKNIKNKKISFFVSDLFEIFKEKEKKFDTIILNPPYLPSELKVKDLTIEGGKKGYEVLERFFNEANDFLKADGVVLIVFSSFTKKEKVDEFIHNNLLELELLKKQHYFFEDLYVYLIKKSLILKKLEKKGIKNVKYFSKGKRGLLYIGDYNNKKVAIKIKNPKSKAISRISNEANFLKLLNKKDIGPRLFFYHEDYIILEYIDGFLIIGYFKKSSKENILRIIRKIMEQLYLMDELKINKEEMSHPQKHILIDKNNKPILIDFERCRKTIKPSNVTQFCDFLSSNNVLKILNNKKIEIDKNKIIELSKKYKKNIDKYNLNKIVNEIK